MPNFSLQEVARRLDANAAWLRMRLVKDQRSGDPKLQFHHYIGTSRVWTLESFEQLRQAIATELEERRQYQGVGRPRKGWTGK